MATKREGEPRGLLYQAAGERNFELARYLPSDDLKFFVEHYWTVRWDLRARSPYRSENLPYPSVHLVIEAGHSGIFGVRTGKFSRLLEDLGRAFGVKFRPGGFYPFVKAPVSRFTNRTANIGEVLGEAGTALETAIIAAGDDEAQMELAEAFLRSRHAERDENVELINVIVGYVASNRDVAKVHDLEKKFGLTMRSLQRLFRRYVGVSPGWVIRRYRLHDAADQLDRNEIVDWPRLAADLGYFDQAHFVKDFKKVTGVSPGEYARRVMPGEKL